MTARLVRSSAITVRRTARPTAAGSGSDTCEVTCRKPLSNASCSIASVVMVADSGRPPPSVLESATKSGNDVVLLEGEHRADAAERRLRLVDDEQHPALFAALLERRHVAVGQRDDAARAEDRLDDRGGGRADRLRVGERHAGVQAGEIAALAAVGDRAAVGIRRRQHHRAGQAGAEPRRPAL